MKLILIIIMAILNFIIVLTFTYISWSSIWFLFVTIGPSEEEQLVGIWIRICLVFPITLYVNLMLSLLTFYKFKFINFFQANIIFSISFIQICLISSVLANQPWFYLINLILLCFETKLVDYLNYYLS